MKNSKINSVLGVVLFAIMLVDTIVILNHYQDLGLGLSYNQASSTGSSQSSYSDNNTSDTCVYGDISCIDNIRVRFRNTGKDILGEQYIGDGFFEIQFVEYGKGTFNASVLVDCECNISAVNVAALELIK